MTRPRCFEDWHAGETIALGRHHVSAEEMLAFAAAYDPQPFHLDEDAARRSIFGGLIASGWHTAAILMRLVAEAPAFTGCNIASPGFDALEWRRPVKAGDTLRGEVRVLDCRPSASKPDRGLVRFAQSLVNQQGETVLSLESMVLYWRRGHGDAAGARA